jgi:hypothetical protein
LSFSFFPVSEENCRSRSTKSWNVPAIANVRADFSERKKNLERFIDMQEAM